jgi:hypothetical protein
VWLAGGGVKPGVTVGETDEVGYNPVADPVSVHNLHATALRLIGIDHTRLTINSRRANGACVCAAIAFGIAAFKRQKNRPSEAD